VVELTQAGQAIVRRARARKIAWLNEVIAELGDDQRPALRSAAALLDRRSLQAPGSPLDARPSGLPGCG
jgi:hypothetical protein